MTFPWETHPDGSGQRHRVQIGSGMPMWIYVSGPYTHGSVDQNIYHAVAAGHAIMDLGHHPYVPHLSHFMHLMRNRDYEDWMRLDLAMVEKCDAVLRIPGYSPGADREVSRAIMLGIPVIYDLDSLPRVAR